MSLLNSMAGAISSGIDNISNQVGRFKHKRFMQGVVAVCAQVAVADGTVSAAEKQKMMGYLQNAEQLRVFNTNEIIAFFSKLVENYEFDEDIGKGEAMKYILALKNEPEMAQLAIRIGIAIAKSDGSFDDTERAVLQEITLALGFPLSAFDL